MTSDRLKKLRSLHQSDATWLCTVRRAPYWITPKKQPAYRPFVMLVHTRTEDSLSRRIPWMSTPRLKSAWNTFSKPCKARCLPWDAAADRRASSLMMQNWRVPLHPGCVLDVHCSFRASLPQASLLCWRSERK